MIESKIEASIRRYCQKQGFPFIKLDANLNKGIPDRMVILPDKVVFVELKTPTGRLSYHQIIWKDKLDRLGHTVHIVTSLKEFKGVIDELYLA